MRRITWVVSILLVMALVVTGCGKKNADDVVKDLNNVVGNMKSYQGVGVMTIHTAQQPISYQVEVWYKNKDYYRVALTNEKKNITQIVLRNKQGVFVLTPSLNKSFRFQSDWPKNQGQIYLYESLVQSISMDNKRQFVKDGSSYVFDVDANYPNMSLDRQKIWLSAKDYQPQKVQVMDKENNVLVSMEFKQFTFNKSFPDSSFDMKKNMSGMTQPSEQTMAGTADSTASQPNPSSGQASTGGSDGLIGTALNSSSQSGTDSASGSSTSKSSKESSASKSGAKKDKGFGVIEPTYLPSGVKKQSIHDMKLNGEQAEMLRYDGKYSYTILETQPRETVSAFPGSIVNLDSGIGVLTEDQNTTLSSMNWTSEGVDYTIMTSNLPVNEMIKVANSVVGQTSK